MEDPAPPLVRDEHDFCRSGRGSLSELIHLFQEHLAEDPPVDLSDPPGTGRDPRFDHRVDQQQLVGILDLARVRRQTLDPQLARITLVGTVMDTGIPKIPVGAPVPRALDAFERTGRWVLPVTDEEGRFAGLVSKSRLFDHYRRELLVQGRTVDG